MRRIYSIKYRLPAVFAILIVASFAVCLLANTFFFEGFYMSKKQSMLEKSYYDVRRTIEKGDDADILSEFEKLMTNSGISVILLDSSGKVVASGTTNVKPLRDQFFEAIFSSGNDENDIVRKDNYFIQRLTNQNNGTDYMVLCGDADENRFIMLRVTIESIKENVALANTFLTYIIVILAVICVFIVFIISKRITDPILDLAGISAGMTELDFNAKYVPRHRGEIDVLGNNMNRMSETLEATISELKVANLKLSEDIKEKIEIDDMRKEFLSNVSHELKTPIALIQGYAEGLKEGVASDEESRREYCDVIIDESAKMNNMVRQLLNLTRLEAGADTLSMERFSIVELAKSRIAAFDIKAKQLGISISPDQAGEIMVWSDPAKTEEVLDNYISNAIDHATGDKVIRVSFTENDDKIRVSVFNTGEPIPEEALDKVWIKLYKVDKARTRQFGGFGLGLSIVKAIMDELGNGYGVENTDEGVCFWFELDKG